MNMRLKRIIPVIIALFVIKGVEAQNTMYYIANAPQAFYLNPASQPQPNFFVGGTFYFDFYHNSIGISDLVWNDEQTGEVLHPFHPDGGMESFLEKFEDVNDLNANMDLSLPSFGFRVRSMYFTFDITSRLNSGISFSKDFVDLAAIGNEDYATYDLSSMGFNFTEHIEIGLGVSRKFGDMITVGIRPKLLLGIASISSRNNEISLYTDHEIWDFDSHIELQMATPGITIPVDEEGVFDPSGEFVFDTTLTKAQAYKNATTGNKGLGVDIGVHVTPMKELKLSASLLDLGYIKWKNYLHTAELDGNFEFTGAEYSSENNANGSDTSSFGQSLLDSLRSNFSVAGTSEPFTTGIGPKIFVGASYAVLPKLEVGLLARFDLPASGFEWDMMLHANWHPTNYFALSASYSPFAGKSSTFGFGITWRSGPFSLFAIADYNTLKYTLYKYQIEDNEAAFLNKNWPVFITSDKREYFNFRFGMNFVLGWNQRKKLMKDKPMYYSGDY